MTLASQAFRDDNTDAVPSSGSYQPAKSDIRDWAQRIWANNRVAVGASRSVTAADNTVTLALTTPGTTLTFPAPASVATGGSFVCAVVNEHATRPMLINANAIPPFWLYPRDALGGAGAVMVVANNGAWYVIGRQRYKMPNGGGLTYHVDSVLGNDANDGLASGVGAAMQTTNAAAYRIANDLDFNAGAGTATIQMHNNDTAGFHWGPHGLTGAASGGSLTIDGGGYSISAANDSSIHLFFNAILEIQNIAPVPGANHAGIFLEEGATLRVRAGVDFSLGTNAAGGSYIQGLDNSSMEFDNDVTLGGQAGAFVFMSGGASCRFGANINLTGNFANTWFAIATNHGRVDFSGATINLNGHTVTGKRFEADNLGLIVSRTGTPSTEFPGSIAGTTSGGGQAV